MTTKTLLPLPGWLALSLLLCAGGALALSGCNVTPGDDDDDDASDDDDVVDPDDDDDVGSCAFAIDQFSESEPNDDEGDADLITVTDEGFMVSGEIEGCAQNYDGWDIFEVTWDCDDEAHVFENWTSAASDIDFYVYGGSGFTPGSNTPVPIEVSGIAVGLSGPEEGDFTVVAGNTYWVAVGCWEGDPAYYELTVSF